MEAYLTIYLSRCERGPDNQIKLICYWVQCAEQTVLAVQQHWLELKSRYGKHPTTINAMGDGPDHNDLTCARLILAFLNSDVCFPPPTLRLSARWLHKCNGSLQTLLDGRHLLFQNILALAFVLDPTVIHVHGSIRQQRQLLARIVDHLASGMMPGQLPRICILLAALCQALAYCGQANASLSELIVEAVTELGQDSVSVKNAFSIAYPDCFPAFPLPLCVEAFVQMIGTDDYRIHVSYRAGEVRLFLDVPVGTEDIQQVRDPRQAVNVARALTADTSARFGGAHRIELMLDPAFFESDDSWTKAVITPWEEGVGHVIEVDECAVVLRWPHTDSTAARLRSVASDGVLRIAADTVCEGIAVFHEPVRGVRNEPLRVALVRSTLTLWQRSEKPLPTDVQDLHWDEVPMAFHGDAWKHVGVALNPPEAPVYRLPGFSATKRSLVIQMRLG